MKVFQQNIFGGEDEVISTIPVIVLKHRGKEGRYLASDIDVADFSDPDGDITIDDIQNAFIIARKDRSKPDLTDVENTRIQSEIHKNFIFEEYGSNATVSFDFEKWLENYEPVNIEMPLDKFNEACILSGWDPVVII